jgi:hypothetical protein
MNDISTLNGLTPDMVRIVEEYQIEYVKTILPLSFKGRGK